MMMMMMKMMMMMRMIPPYKVFILNFCREFIVDIYFRMRGHWGGSKISLVFTLVENLWLRYFMDFLWIYFLGILRGVV